MLKLVAMVLGAMVSTLYQLVAIATVLDDRESTLHQLDAMLSTSCYGIKWESNR